MKVLGLSCYDHDSAACLVQDGRILAAIEEERLTRCKHDAAFPALAVRAVLKESGVDPSALDAVVFYEKPADRLARLWREGADEERIELAAQGLALEKAVQEALGYQGRILYADHLLSHAAISFYASPYDKAAVLVLDDYGEAATTAIYTGQGTQLSLRERILAPHSLGLFFGALTAFLGFESREGEYKVMGLASYGKPTFRDLLSKLVTLHKDGSFTLDLDYFDPSTGLYTQRLTELLGAPRAPETRVTEKDADLAASIQSVMEEALSGLARYARQVTGLNHLCLGGALAHNIVANAKLRQSRVFDDVFIHFASGNNGAAAGAALYACYNKTSLPRFIDRPCPYLGPSYHDDEIEQTLRTSALSYRKVDRATLVDAVAHWLADGAVVGWHQGRMEFGPRALGARSILASACRADMKDILNARIKYREEFRPFAPVVVAESARDYFEIEGESPFMLYGTKVREDKRAQIPAVTHSDGSARPQTIRRDDNPLYYDVVQAFGRLSGHPVLINTSFNIRGEPIVCSPQDAINCFTGTDMDYLVIGSYLVFKTDKAV